MDWNLLLHIDGTPHCPVDAIEYDEQGVATGLDDPAAVLIDRRVYQVPTEGPQSFESSLVVQANEPAVSDHVGINHSDQLSPFW